MFKNISKLGKDLNKSQQQQINGGSNLSLVGKVCGGDGSFIYQDGVKVCCFQPGKFLGQGTYIC